MKRVDNAKKLDQEALEMVNGGSQVVQFLRTTDNVNVRSGPSLNSEVVGTLEHGDKVSFLGVCRSDARGVGWYKVYFDGRVAWVSSICAEPHTL